MSSRPSPPFWQSALVFGLLCALLGTAGWWYWTSQNRSAPPATGAATPPKANLVRVTTVASQDFAMEVVAVGTVRAFESINLSANVTETLTSLHFDDGDFVKKGALLATLSDAEEQAMMASARASLAEQSREIDRLRSLVEEGAAPAARLEERLTLKEIADQSILEAEARLQDRQIVAPFDGWVGLRRISVGALVSPGTVIASLDQIDKVKIDFTLPETLLGTIVPGSSIVANTATSGEESFTGTLSHLDSRVDPLTRSVAARAEVANPDRDLLPGMLVTVHVAVDPATSPAVPERALVPIGTRQFVFVVKDGIAERREIRIGLRKPGFVEVKTGVALNEVVITDGLLGLQPGATVTVQGTFEKPSTAFNPEVTD